MDSQNYLKEKQTSITLGYSHTDNVLRFAMIHDLLGTLSLKNLMGSVTSETSTSAQVTDGARLSE